MTIKDLIIELIEASIKSSQGLDTTVYRDSDSDSDSGGIAVKKVCLSEPVGNAPTVWLE